MYDTIRHAEIQHTFVGADRSTVLAADFRTIYFGNVCNSVHTVAAHSQLRLADHSDLGRLGLAAAVSACADQQLGTHSHRIC